MIPVRDPVLSGRQIPTKIVASDLNGDGYRDVYVGTDTQFLSAFLGTSDPTMFTTAQPSTYNFRLS